MQKKILLADDDPSVRKMLCRLLEIEHYQVTLASSGRDAVARFRAETPDLILLDLKMPDQNGWEALEQMSATGPMPPVIIITAFPHQERRAAENGADAFLEKPLHLPLLLQTISDLLRFRSLSESLAGAADLCSAK
jgi:DNA-binding response OmpR family regulator